MALTDDDMTTSTGGDEEGPADSGAGGGTPGEHDGGADGGAEGPADSGAGDGTPASPTAARTAARTAVPAEPASRAPGAAPAAAAAPAPRRAARLSTRRDFAERHWGREPLLRRGADAGAFRDLLDLDGVDELLSRRGLRTPFLRLAKDGAWWTRPRSPVPAGSGAEIGDQVRDDKVAALFADGATVVLQALHRTWPPVIDLATALAAELGHPVQANAYVTPPAVPRLHRALRRARRVRAAARRAQALDGARAGAPRPAARPALERPRQRRAPPRPRRPAGARHGAGAGRRACTCPGAGCTPPPRAARSRRT